MMCAGAKGHAGVNFNNKVISLGIVFFPRRLNNKVFADMAMLLAANFTGRDLFVTLTYRPEDLPKNRKAAQDLAKKFIRAMRTHRKARGQGFKYIYTTEEKHGDARLHHHLIINGTGNDLETIKSLWPYGDIVDIEYLGKSDYETWALYMTKEGVSGRPVGAQLWTTSRNLKKPVVRSIYVSNDSAIQAPAGCFVLEKEEKVTEFGNYSYIKYTYQAEEQTAKMHWINRILGQGASPVSDL